VAGRSLKGFCLPALACKKNGIFPTIKAAAYETQRGCYLISQLMGRLLRRTNNLPESFVGLIPADQNALDIFKGEWSSRLPDQWKELNAGTIPLFEDSRILWAADQLGGFRGKRILELGPLEAGHTYMLERLGADAVTAVEANQRAYLKCLIVKEILNLKHSRFMLGDCVAFLRQHQTVFDVCLASGLLYHMSEPSELIYLMSKTTNKLFLWTHFYDEKVIRSKPNLARRFSGSMERRYQGFDHVLHRYDYGAGRHRAGFCGGVNPYSHWMSREDLLACLRFFGFQDVRIAFDDPNHPNGPSFCVAALRSA
jgi:hypothetical protein